MPKFRCKTIIRANTYRGPSGNTYVFAPGRLTKIPKEDAEYFRGKDIFVEEKAAEAIKKKVTEPLKPKKVRKGAGAEE